MSQPVLRVHHHALDALQSLLTILVVTTFILTFLVQPFRIPSESMEPTLKVGDFLLVNKQAFAPRGVLDAILAPTTVRRGDVMVFHFPVDPTVLVVKRVVALPGDRLRLHDGRLILNGRGVAEPYAYYASSLPDTFRDNFPAPHRMDAQVDPQWFHVLERNVRDGEMPVPPARFFVLGDNRNDSEDSRYWGFVPQAEIVGRPVFVYFTLGADSGKPWRQRLTGWVKQARLVR